MKKVAVFGNTGGGKSTLSRKLSEMTNLPLYVLDKIQYKPGGVQVPYEEYIAEVRSLKSEVRSKTLVR